MRLFRQPSNTPPSQVPVAHPIEFEGRGVYEIALDRNWGAVFEDDGSTGYLYLTSATFDHIYDALHIYDSGSAAQLAVGERAVLVWASSIQKVGLFFRGQFQAVASLSERRACCRSGFPANAPAEWGGSSHAWDEAVVRGLGP